ASEVLAVADGLEARRAVLPEDRIRLGCGDSPEENVPPADLAAVRLELDRTLLGQRQLAVPEVFQPGVIHHQLAIEVDGDPLADHEDTETVPFAERLVGQ